MTLAIIQARMGSKRLPGKALSPLAGQPLIWRQLERLKAARTLTRIVVATSCEPADDALAAWLVSQGQAVFRGAPADLLDRFARCAESAGPAGHVVRIKGDAPFVDPRVIDEAVRQARIGGADYVSNRAPASYPRGMEVEVIATSALVAAAAEPRETMARVSPTAFIRANPGRFSQASFSYQRDLSKLDWRVKTSADLAFARSIYGALYAADPGFGMADVLDLVGGRQDLARFSYAA
jgi:spore coat polysaccharide biosynthesis protein SpsF